jgi:hypothetical protein
VSVAGHLLLLPASPTDGPLVPHPDGWASDYAPTTRGAAIAVLRGPWLVMAAPPALRDAVTARVLTPAAAAEPGPVNPGPGWALPADLRELLDGLDLRLLGATATLTDDDHAVVHVDHERVTPTGPVLVRTTHRLVYADRQWRIDADYSDAPAAVLDITQQPATYTVTGPEA